MDHSIYISTLILVLQISTDLCHIYVWQGEMNDEDVILTFQGL